MKLKTFFLVSRVLSFRHTKQISKNVADTTFKCSTNMILQFLADFFNDAYEHNTIATFRFTISAYHYLINGVPVGKEFLVTALLSGACCIKLKQPRYTFIWDVKKLLVS